VRQAIALSVYLFPRAAELRALRWRDFDLKRGVVHMHQAVERYSGEAKGTKTKSARRFSVEPAILPLLLAMRATVGDAEGADDELVAPDLPDVEELAVRLRRYMQRAGIDRADLFANDATRKHMTWHDLRATGLTWCAVRGDEPFKIKQRAGHANLATTEGYVREASSVADAFGEVFPPLPSTLLGPNSDRGGPKLTESSENPRRKARRPHGVRSLGLEHPSQRDPETQGPTRAEPVSEAPRASVSDHVSDRDQATARAPRTLLDDLAALVARAVAAGDLTLARALIDAQAKASPASSAPIVDFAAERARRGAP
jgi:hypothetical protein